MVVDEHKDIRHGCNFFDGLLYYSEFKSVLKKNAISQLQTEQVQKYNFREK